MEQLISTLLQNRTVKPATSIKQKVAIEAAIKVSLLIVLLALWIFVSITSEAVATYQSIAAGTTTCLLAILHILGQSSSKGFKINN